MFKLNKSTRIALYAMMELARAPEVALSAQELSERFAASRHHLAKVLQQLARGGLVQASRGVGGGHRLARDPKDIDLMEIVETFEGRHGERAQCLLPDAPQGRRRAPVCDLHALLRELDEQIQATLRSVSLKTVVTHGYKTP